jgi:hypothetical protein
MIKKPKRPKTKPKKTLAEMSIAEAFGYTHRDFKRWGKMGGRPTKYVSDAERKRAYRRRKTKTKLYSGEKQGIFSMKTGRIRQYANQAERQRAYRLRKKLNNLS